MAAPNSYALPYKSQIEIDDCDSEIDVWSDRHLNDEVIVFSASKNCLLIEQVICLGLIILESNSVFLSNDELWEIGIP